MRTLLPGLTFADVAKATHEANRAICEAHGDTSQTSWDDAPEWQKDSAKDGVHFHLGTPDAQPEDSHNNWMKQKVADGWVYGETKDSEAKTHPCMVPYTKLPVEQRVKDYVFKAVVHALSQGAPL